MAGRGKGLTEKEPGDQDSLKGEKGKSLQDLRLYQRTNTRGGVRHLLQKVGVTCTFCCDVN